MHVFLYVHRNNQLEWRQNVFVQNRASLIYMSSPQPPCSRWHSSYECNCPKGPKGCPCVKRAPKPPTHPGTCGQYDSDEVVIVSDLIIVYLPVFPRQRLSQSFINHSIPTKYGVPLDDCSYGQDVAIGFHYIPFRILISGNSVIRSNIYLILIVS